MRDKEALAAIAAFVAAVAIMAGAIVAFLVFVGNGSDGMSASPERPSLFGRRSSPAPPRCSEPAACRTPTPEFAAAYNDPAACQGTEKRVCLAPLGEVPKDLVDHLVQYYKSEYGLTLHVLPAVALNPGFAAKRPGQLEAQFLEDRYKVAYSAYPLDRNVTLIGLTSIDIYTADRPEWRWFFGQMGDGHAVISVFRMDPLNWGEPKDDALRNKRVRTLMDKYVAMSYYGLSLNNNPRSVLYQLIGGLDTLDQIDERIPVPR